MEQVRGSGTKIFQEDETDRKLDVFEHWGKVGGELVIMTQATKETKVNNTFIDSREDKVYAR